MLALGVAAMAMVPYGAAPTEAQMKWHEVEQYVLVHFTPTTFENKEWGFGDADPKSFNPTDFDASQIVKAAKSGHFRGLILVAKHHDGFCLWPTKTTPYNISRSPWRNGRGDMVREFAAACKKQGLKFGVYCSPWDRNHPEYGRATYPDVYRAQLTELYTRYGDLFMSWHDGANGGDGFYGGARETRLIDRATYYDWKRTWAITRKLQPNAVIFSDVGPDVRWVGNESGFAAEDSWATFTPRPLPGKKEVGPGEMDYKNSPTGTPDGDFWIPAECDVPLRPGWFYHPDQDGKVKTPEMLFNLWLKSVGRGAALDLGLAPDTRGRLADSDVRSLAGLGALLDQHFGEDLSPAATCFVDGKRLGRHHPLSDNNKWSGIPGEEVTLEWPVPVDIGYLRLREDIRLGQRVRAWSVVSDGVLVAKGQSIGACRVVPIQRSSRKLKVVVHGPVTPVLSQVSAYRASRS